MEKTIKTARGLIRVIKTLSALQEEKDYNHRVAESMIREGPRGTP